MYGLFLDGGCRDRLGGAGPGLSSWEGGTALWVERKVVSRLGAPRQTAGQTHVWALAQLQARPHRPQPGSRDLAPWTVAPD